VAPGIYELYDEYFAAIRDRPITLLELGVYLGESLKVFGTYFENGRIIGIDIEDRGIDFSSHPNVRFEIGDQRNAARLSEVCATHASDGLDIIIDDASHIGTWSLMSYNALFPHLDPGGLYMIEDWYLVDEVMSSGIRPSITAPITRPDRLELMHIHKQIVVLQKAGSPEWESSSQPAG
jgi:hypothetical protein